VDDPTVRGVGGSLSGKVEQAPKTSRGARTKRATLRGSPAAAGGDERAHAHGKPPRSSGSRARMLTAVTAALLLRIALRSGRAAARARTARCSPTS
jgi:hypothetical protein